MDALRNHFEADAMKAEQTTTKDDLNLRDVARTLSLDYKKLEKEGQVKQLFSTGVTKAMPVRLEVAVVDGRPVNIDTTARLVIGTDKEGKRSVNMNFKNDKPQLDRYRDINLNPEQQKELQRGKTLVVKDANDLEHLIKFDKELNKVAGMKKSIFLVPERLGSLKEGYTKLTNTQQASLKQGEAVQLEIGGKKVTAQLDPVERKLNVQRTPKESLNIKPTDQKRKIGPSL